MSGRGSTPEPSPALRAEIESEPGWMYPWRLGGGVEPPLLHPGMPSLHRTRAEMIEPGAREALARAGAGARALDIACHEGWFAHRLLEWGAERVVAVDIREINVRRATLVRDHLGVPADRLEIRQADVYDLRAADLGRFDVVLALGVVYHLENPIGALRVVRSLTDGLCVVESQLTRQEAPISMGWGPSDDLIEEPASWAARREASDERDTLHAFGDVVSMVPNRAALIQGMTAAGFRDVHALPAAAHHTRQYVDGDRIVLTGRA